MLLAAADDNGRHFGHHCRWRTSPDLIKHRGKHKFNFYIYLLDLLNRFDGGIGTSTRKASHPSGWVGSSNPRRWRGQRLHHHGDGVCLLFVLFVLSCLVVVTRCM